MPIFIGIDNGNFNQKSRSTVFKTGLVTNDAPNPFSADLMQLGNKYHSLLNERAPYEKDKTKSERAFILTLFALAKEIESRISKGLIKENETGSYQVVLGLGVPPEHMLLADESRQPYHKRFQSYFFNKINEYGVQTEYGKVVQFNYNQKDYSILIEDVFVFPQAFSAYVPFKKHLQELDDFPRFLLVDIGGFTTDVLEVKDGKPDINSSRSEDFGVIRMVDYIRRKVGKSYKEDDIVAVLSGKTLKVPQAVLDNIYAARDEYFQNHIVANLLEQGVDLNVVPAVFLGGGSLLLQGSVENSKNISNATFISDISANATGYEQLAQSAYAKKHK